MESVHYRSLSPEFEAKINQIELFAEKFLRFVPRSIPDYPSHGVDHSKNIIEHLENLIEKWPIRLLDEEIYLLYLGAWLHDIGIIIDRNEHNLHSAYIINQTSIFENILGKETQNMLMWIVKAHSSSFNMMEVPLEIRKIRLRFISSIFRILDACEIIYTKCPAEVYQLIEQKLNPESKKYWESHMSILSVDFNNPNIVFYVNDKNKSELLVSHLIKEIESVREVFQFYGVTFPVVKVVETKPY